MIGGIRCYPKPERIVRRRIQERPRRPSQEPSWFGQRFRAWGARMMEIFPQARPGAGLEAKRKALLQNPREAYIQDLMENPRDPHQLFLERMTYERMRDPEGFARRQAASAKLTGTPMPPQTPPMTPMTPMQMANEHARTQVLLSMMDPTPYSSAFPRVRRV
eukprot:Gregarina_sp_Poly_1__7161@NODE_3929_length_820_cov_5_099602_g2542_i0_p1_GENE_NODE_3929_length_820_cov_5_099602_g2542_i0NODE_3929_length_820_cov_5_099602_g2542_i0_p1_ORF_typecomplete_len173_score10_54_NODE_3929_length_820_cov_5_099602_g2542_i036521